MKRTLAVNAAIVLFLVAGLRLGAQTPAAPAFEVASIKPSPPGDPSNPLTMIPMAAPQPGGRFKATNFPLWAIISTAWQLPDFRIVGGNKELMNVKYDIIAKADGSATLGQKELLPLLKSLVIERFQLKSHLEPREMGFYDLVLARSDGRLGPELKTSKSDCSNVDELNAKRAEALAKGDYASLVPKPGEFLSCTIAPNLATARRTCQCTATARAQGAGRPLSGVHRLTCVIDGLTGRYDFDW